MRPRTLKPGYKPKTLDPMQAEKKGIQAVNRLGFRVFDVVLPRSVVLRQKDWNYGFYLGISDTGDLDVDWRAGAAWARKEGFPRSPKDYARKMAAAEKEVAGLIGEGKTSTYHSKNGRFTSYDRANIVNNGGQKFRMVRKLEPVDDKQGDGSPPPDASTAENVTQVKAKVSSLAARIAPQWLPLDEVVR